MHHNETRYLEKISALRNDYLPSAYRILCGVVIVLIVVSMSILWFTPWIQTAYGTGHVDSLDPSERTQAISALVSGQIKQWHVKEGMPVEKGQPIVTLIDVDEELVTKLQGQLDAAQAVHAANQSAVANARNNLSRQQALLEQGVASTKTVEAAQIKLQELIAKAAKSQSDINKASVALSRQRTQTKVAPADGVIVHLKSGGPSTYVKAGEILGEFIPEVVRRTVRVKISGLNAPLIEKGRKVRLQFEGWPVFQFSGWPDAAIGTFGGEVIYVEPVADNAGNFTVWIAPDPNGTPWPQEQVVRYGSRVKAWILLEEVRLIYELWRQLNNFPPKPIIDKSNAQSVGK